MTDETETRWLENSWQDLATKCGIMPGVVLEGSALSIALHTLSDEFKRLASENNRLHAEAAANELIDKPAIARLKQLDAWWSAVTITQREAMLRTVCDTLCADGRIVRTVRLDSGTGRPFCSSSKEATEAFDYISGNNPQLIVALDGADRSNIKATILLDWSHATGPAYNPVVWHSDGLARDAIMNGERAAEDLLRPFEDKVEF